MNCGLHSPCKRMRTVGCNPPSAQRVRLMLLFVASLWLWALQECSFASLERPREGRILVQSGRHKLWYRVTQSLDKSSGGSKHAPLVVLHGGPQVPSDYLFDLAELRGRPVVFYDQLGCGRSDAPPINDADYSIASSVADLRELLGALGIGNYHLYGQSWGGILAYEHLSRPIGADGPSCLSVILSSSPTSVRLVEQEADKLVASCSQVVADKGVDEADTGKLVAELFRSRHQCRTREYPQLLSDAQAKAGSIWRGSAAISGWQLGNVTIPTRFPALVMHGEHDFVNGKCVEDWSRVFLGLEKVVTLKGCAHHGLLEDPKTYLDTIDRFIQQHS